MAQKDRDKGKQALRAYFNHCKCQFCGKDKGWENPDKCPHCGRKRD